MSIESEKIKLPLRTVYTSLNTPLAEWTAMLIAEIKRLNIDASKITKLAARHAWEYEYSPQSYAVAIQHMNDRAVRKTANKPKIW
jgi:hypothetical protein